MTAMLVRQVTVVDDRMWLIFDGFPHGNVFLLGRRVEKVLKIMYRDERRIEREMDPRHYLHIGDRVVLAVDKWPKPDLEWRETVSDPPVCVEVLPASERQGRWR